MRPIRHSQNTALFAAVALLCVPNVRQGHAGSANRPFQGLTISSYILDRDGAGVAADGGEAAVRLMLLAIADGHPHNPSTSLAEYFPATS